ncbi:MAG TPA: adenylate kinase [Steroidobacteraceae bacterium]
MMRIVLLGAPGSGKGTQAQRLQARHGVPQVSSGDLLRDAVARGTELGKKAKAVMEAGQLVSDDIVLGLIRDRLSRPDAANGFILDGFPRNIDQANSLNDLLREIGQPLDAVLLLDVRNATLMQRLAGRRICPKCGTVYAVSSMPAGNTVCPKDGAELYQRPDDKEEVIAKRLEVYAQQTQPLIKYYTKLGLLRTVAGEGDLDAVAERMEAAALAKPIPAGKISVARKSRAVAKSRTRPANAPLQARMKVKVKASGKVGTKTAKGKAAKAKAGAKKVVKRPARKVAAKTPGKRTSAKRPSIKKSAVARRVKSATRKSAAGKSGRKPVARRKK